MIKMNQDYTLNNIYYHYIIINIYLLGVFYLFLSVGIDLGGFSLKYCSKSLMTYDKVQFIQDNILER